MEKDRALGEIVVALTLMAGYETEWTLEELLRLMSRTCPPCLVPHFAKIKSGVMRLERGDRKQALLKRLAEWAAADPALR